MKISESFWKTMREARLNQLIHAGFKPEFAESFANTEDKYRKKLSENHEPWAGVVATLEFEDDEHGDTHWFIVCNHFLE
ncbi:hypothetical protein [Ruegeria sp. PrR005]|uniref:Uncharacterized protein n=1 Tax=Ruegeria sp. PrR005 TaxID=2706882 RepID=A0A6B2NRR0_9RHOB|nr:hypothetical protein [Ruegeria sp. PrR005]NDW45277.1 hypothetical protein [Ruegeria sp. PrR005]